MTLGGHVHIFGSPRMAAAVAPLIRSCGWTCSLRTSSRLWNPATPEALALSSAGVSVTVQDRLDAAFEAGEPHADGDIALSFGAPWIFSEQWLARWRGLAFNCHARRLPQHRGAGGASWLILMQERDGSACIHELTSGIDDGPVVAARPFTYPAGDLLPAEFDEIDRGETLELLRAWLPQALGGKIERREQDPTAATYWPRLSTDLHGWVDWSWSVDEIATFCRAFGKPYAGAQTYLRGEPVRLKRTRSGADEGRFHPFQRGLIFRIDATGLHVAVTGGSLVISEVELSRPELPARVGDRLWTPGWVLERALASRVTYLPDGSMKVVLAGPLTPS